MKHQIPAPRTLKSLRFERAIVDTFRVGPKTRARIIDSDLGYDLMETPTELWEHLTEVQTLKALIADRNSISEALGAIDSSQYLITKAA